MAEITLLTYAAQAESGSSAAVDVSAYSTLRLDLELAEASVCNVINPEVDITIETAPKSDGPWRPIVERRKYVSGSSTETYGWTTRRRFLLSGFDKFARVSWDCPGRFATKFPVNLSVGLAGEAT